MYKEIKTKIKNILPSTIWKILKTIKHPIKPIVFRLTLAKVQKNHKNALKKVREKVKKGEKIKVVFFPIQEQAWKYENLYRLLDKSPLFDPILVVCPYLAYGNEIMQDILDKAYKYFKEKDYTVINSYSKESNTWLDVKKEIKPDIVFFSVPYNYTKTEYCINNFLDTLTCYVPYSFQVSSLTKTQYDMDFHNFLWKAFYETNIHKKIALNNSRNIGKNVEVVGYPNIDRFFFQAEVIDQWKIKDKGIKRIVWSPHHTIEGFGAGLNYSNFLKMADFMLDFAKKNVNRIQIAFKPHPLLKSRLYRHSDWGKEKTENYYKQWSMLPNGFFSNSDYIDLFLTSDGLINDSGSFLAEYFFSGKPQIFVAHDKNIVERFNDFGKYIFQKVYVGYQLTEIEKFINEIIIGGQDYMRKIRINEINNYRNKLKNVSSSKKIIEIIKLEVK